MLAAEIEAARRRAQIEAWETGERAMAAGVASQIELPPFELNRWCNSRSVRYLPALPTSVAGWLLEQGSADVFAMLDAISVLHGMNGRADPTSVPIVRAALERVVEIKPPRSWPKEDRALWATLPAQIRERIATREQQRDVELRRLQNDYAEKLKTMRDHSPSGPAKDIFDLVSSDGTRNYGLSAQVFSGRRKAHPAKDSSAGSGIDRDTPRFKKQRDWN